MLTAASVARGGLSGRIRPPTGAQQYQTDKRTQMIYISEVAIQGFRCFEREELCLNHITVLFGPNNSGKSSFLNLIRRFNSANINRHPPKSPPGGGGVLR